MLSLMHLLWIGGLTRFASHYIRRVDTLGMGRNR